MSRIRKISLIVIVFSVIFISLGLMGFFTPDFEKEVKYYKQQPGYNVEEKPYYESFINYEEVSKTQLRQEAKKILENRPTCRIFINREKKIIFINTGYYHQF